MLSASTCDVRLIVWPYRLPPATGTFEMGVDAMTTDRTPSSRPMKLFSIVTPERMARVALTAAVGYAIAGFAVGGEGMVLVYLCVLPLLLLSGALWLGWLPAAWIAALLGLVIFLLGLLIGPVAGGILALIGLAALVSELPHLRQPQQPAKMH
jgi:hypothetical protein